MKQRTLNAIACGLLTLACLWGCLPQAMPTPTHDFVGGPRSSCWRETRAAYVATHPTCEACGEPTDEVHHEVPFSTSPSLECDPKNLVAFCHQHHFELGHARNYRFHNANVRRDVERYREMIANRKPNK